MARIERADAQRAAAAGRADLPVAALAGYENGKVDFRDAA